MQLQRDQLFGADKTWTDL